MNLDLLESGLLNASYFLDSPLIRPKMLQISLTNRCNLQCRMCSVNKYVNKEEDELSLDEAEKVISIASKQFSIRTLILTGGEPLLLKEKIIRLVKFANQLNISVMITTNGFFLEEYANELAQAGVKFFHISIDGLKDTHNYLRNNPKSFEKAISGLKLLISLREKHNYKYIITMASVILKNNIDELNELFKFGDDLGVDVYELLAYLPDNTEFSHIEPTSLWPNNDDVSRFVKAYSLIKSQKTKHIKLNQLFDINLMAKYYSRKLDKTDWRCLAGFKNLFITLSDPKKQGRFEPCLFLCKDHIPLRDFDYNLEKIWYSPRADKARAQIKKCNVYCYQSCFAAPFTKINEKNNNL